MLRRDGTEGPAWRSRSPWWRVARAACSGRVSARRCRIAAGTPPGAEATDDHGGAAHDPAPARLHDRRRRRHPGLHNYVIVEGRQNAGGNGYDFDPMFAEITRPHLGRRPRPLPPGDADLGGQHRPHGAPDQELQRAPGDRHRPEERRLRRLRHGVEPHLGPRGRGRAPDARRARRRRPGPRRLVAQPGGGGDAPIYEAKGVKVGHLAFSYTIDNSGAPTTRVPAGDAVAAASMLWPAHRRRGHPRPGPPACASAGAEFVVVSMHWGAEYLHAAHGPAAPAGPAAAGRHPTIDLILGDHVHVVQPCEQIGGKYVMYGMGNFLSNQSPSQDTSLRPGQRGRHAQHVHRAGGEPRRRSARRSTSTPPPGW